MAPLFLISHKARFLFAPAVINKIAIGFFHSCSIKAPYSFFVVQRDRAAKGERWVPL